MKIEIDTGVIGKKSIEICQSLSMEMSEKQGRNRGRNNKKVRRLNAVLGDVHRCSEMIVDVIEE